MRVVYEGYIYSKNKKLDNLPVSIKVGAPVSGKYRYVQPLCNNATVTEKKWYEEHIIPNVIKD
jgi:hypothetical protein